MEFVDKNYLKECMYISSNGSLTSPHHFSLECSVSEPQEVSTRVMIFSSFRESVQEIAGMLNRHTPLIRVMTFMGQASAGKGVKGFTQKEQLEVEVTVAHRIRQVTQLSWKCLCDGTCRPRCHTYITIKSYQGNQINKWV